MNETAYSSRYRFVIGGLSMWAQFTPGLLQMSLAPLLPRIIDEYGITHAAAGLLIGVVTIVQSLGSIPAGIAGGRLGVWRTFSISWLLMGLVVLSALAPGFYTLLALRIALGVGMAAILPATGPLMMQWFRAKERPVLSGLNQASLALGITVALFTAVPLADVMGWQNVLSLYGAVGLAGALAWIVWGRTREEAGSAAEPLAWREIGSLLASPPILWIGLAHGGILGQQFALVTWLPTFYQETRDMSESQAGFTTGLIPFMVTAGLLLGGFLPLKLSNKRLFLIVPGVMVALGGLGSYLIDHTAVTYVALVLLGLGGGLYAPTLMVLPMEFPGTSPQKVAIVWGWILMSGGVAVSVTPLLVGAIRDATDGFTLGFLAVAGPAWLMLLVGCLLPRVYLRGTGAPDMVSSPSTRPE